MTRRVGWWRWGSTGRGGRWRVRGGCCCRSTTTAAARALWRDGVRPAGSPSVAQWRWLGERGLSPSGKVPGSVAPGLPAQQVAVQAAQALGVPVSVVDADGRVHEAGQGAAGRVTLLALPDGGLVGTATLSNDLATVLSAQAPVGCGPRR